MSEPSITINGAVLTEGQAMTVRVALEDFASYLHADGLGPDKIGTDMTAGYLRNIREIRRLMTAARVT